MTTTIEKFSQLCLGNAYNLVSIFDEHGDYCDLDEDYLDAIKKYKNTVVLIKAIVQLKNGYEYVIGKIMSTDETIEWFQGDEDNIIFPIFYNGDGEIKPMIPSDIVMLTGKFPNYGFPHDDGYLTVRLEKVDLDDI